LGKFLKIAVWFIILAGCVSAANFGSAAKSESAIAMNDTASFSLLFWTSDSEAQVRLKILASPPGWDVQLGQESFEIGNGHGSEFVQTAAGYASAVSVPVQASSGDAKPGKYSILISASTNPGGAGMSLFQERIFNLTIVVQDKNSNDEQAAAQNPATAEKESNQTGLSTIYIGALALIIFISVLIYKYS